jgi:hypothetical protein
MPCHLRSFPGTLTSVPAMIGGVTLAHHSCTTSLPPAENLILGMSHASLKYPGFGKSKQVDRHSERVASLLKTRS